MEFWGPLAHYLHMSYLLRFLKDEEGQDLIEYTLLMAFIALASASIFVGAGGSVNSIWQNASNQLSNAAVSAS
jgi:Flp pilus assembly pilin Flp